MDSRKGRPRPALAVAVILIVALAWAGLLALNLVPELRGDFGWRWPYELPHSLPRVLLLAASVALYAVAGVWLLGRRRAIWLLGWAVLGAVGLTLAGLFVTESPLFKLYAVTVSPGVTSWHYAAATITDIGKTLREWPAFMKVAVKYSTHLGIVPPGAVLFYYELNQALQGAQGLAHVLAAPLRLAMCQNFELAQYSDAQLASAWAGMLMPLWGGLTVLPMYRLGARLVSERAARWSVLWWPRSPNLLMFTGSLNTFFPLLAACDILLLVEGLLRGRRSLVFAAGLLASVMTFISFAFFPLLFLAGMLVLLGFIARASLYTASTRAFAPARAPWLWPLVVGALFGAGLLVVWVLYDVLAGVSFFDVLRTASAAHLAMDRPYLPWLYMHLYDYFIFTGWPLVILAVIAVVAGVAMLIRRNPREPLSTSALLAVSAAATLVVLDLSGTMRGESGRILLFLTPFFLLGAAGVVTEGGLSGFSRAGWLLTAGQAVMAVVMISFLRVMGAEFNAPAPVTPPPLAQPSPRESFPNGATFANALRLNTFSGYVSDAPEGRDANGAVAPVLNVWLEWQSSGQVDVPYWMSLLPVAPDGKLGEALLRQPFDTQYPITCWLPRSGVIREQFTIPLPPTTKEGPYWVSLSLLDRTGKPAPVVMPDGSRDTQTGLGAFNR